MTTTAESKKVNAITLLKGDHRVVRALLKEWVATKSDRARRQQLHKQIEKELKIHTQIEEEIFYPAFHEAATAKKDEKMFYEAHEEHHLIDIVLAEIKRDEVSSEQFAAKAKVIKDLVEHHAEEEEQEMFPRASKLLSRSQLQELGEKLEVRKKELQKKI